MARLERHACRRAAGVATVSVLNGGLDAAVALWHQAAAAQGWTTVRVPTLAESCLAPTLARLAAGRNDGRACFAAWLAGRTGEDAGAAAAVLAEGRFHERRHLAHRAGLRNPASGSEALAAAVLLDAELPVYGAATAGDTGRTLGVWWDALQMLFGADAVPAVLVAPEEGALGPARLQRQLGLVDQVLAQAPRATVALCASDGQVVAPVQPETRWESLLCEGLVNVADTEPIHPVPPSVFATALDATTRYVARMADVGEDRLLVRYYERAAHAALSPAYAGPCTFPGARSWSEAVLFTALEADSRTRGQFRLNVPVHTADPVLPRVEVDLLAAGVRTAVEVDGPFHFRCEQDYRHDRRKDLALQQAGYLVLRFLAGDVVTRLDEVLNTIVCTIEQHDRRRAAGGF